MARPRSFRSHLTLGYAGIALLTALLLSAIIAVALPPFFSELEAEYARNAAVDAVNRLKESGGVGPEKEAQLGEEVERIAQADRVRVRVTDLSGRVLADSGPPSEPGAVSSRTRVEPFLNRDGREVARIEISAGPKAGEGLTARIMWAWAVAITLSIAVAAAFGYFLARRVSQPITELTRISGEMAHGDLSVRAAEQGDVEVRILATAFNEMADGVEETFGSLRRFIGDAAHEIGTPLTALQADLELARESPGDACVPDLLDQALGHAERIRRLTRDLLTLSRLESVGALSEHQLVDLSELVNTIMDSVASRAEQAELELVFNEPPSRVVVVGDAAALTRALENLLDNALKFTPAGGAISVSIEEGDTTATLRVSDTGTGIDPRDVPHVFERFYRARGAGSAPGSGLGLAIVRAIADAHGGDVRLASGPDGTAVELRFPLAG